MCRRCLRKVRGRRCRRWTRGRTRPRAAARGARCAPRDARACDDGKEDARGRDAGEVSGRDDTGEARLGAGLERRARGVGRDARDEGERRGGEARGKPDRARNRDRGRNLVGFPFGTPAVAGVRGSIERGRDAHQTGEQGVRFGGSRVHGADANGSARRSGGRSSVARGVLASGGIAVGGRRISDASKDASSERECESSRGRVPVLHWRHDVRSRARRGSRTVDTRAMRSVRAARRCARGARAGRRRVVARKIQRAIKPRRATSQSQMMPARRARG